MDAFICPPTVSMWGTRDSYVASHNSNNQDFSGRYIELVSGGCKNILLFKQNSWARLVHIYNL